MAVRISLLMSAVALGLATYSVVSGPSGEQHRCGRSPGAAESVVSCISNDTPSNYKERACAPSGSSGRVVVWLCSKP